MSRHQQEDGEKPFHMVVTPTLIIVQEVIASSLFLVRRSYLATCSIYAWHDEQSVQERGHHQTYCICFEAVPLNL
jgi:hypothetical protein